MEIAYRPRYKNQGKTINKAEKYIDIKFDLNTLNLMCSYVISENSYIRRVHLINLRNLISILDMSIYSNDPEKMIRINFINRGLDAKINNNLKDKDVVLKFINGGIIDNDYIDQANFKIMSTEEINWINKTVSESLKYAFIYNDVDKMLELSTAFKSASYDSRGEIVTRIEELVNTMQTKFRRVKVETMNESVFSLKDGVFEYAINDIHDSYCNPSSRLITGMQGFNELLGGSFESSRVYMIFGLTGGGKSLTLLNIAQQIKKYNTTYKTKDPTKVPVVVYLTMENSVKETVGRLFSMINPDTNKKIQDYEVEDIMRILKEDGELYLTDKSPIDIIVKYVPNNSVDTGYLYTMTEDLEDEGYEVIALIQDHVKRIRPAYPTGDLRLDLGNVVNDFKTYATLKDVVVISNSHLNRDAASKIDNANTKTSSDLTRLLGRSNIGESLLMLDNLDGGYIIGIEYDQAGQKYLGIKRIKERFECTSRQYIAQPFVGDGIKLVEDYYMPVPVFKESLASPDGNDTLFHGGTNIRQSNYGTTIRDFDSVVSERQANSDTKLGGAARYDSNTIDSITLPRTVASKQSERILKDLVVFDKLDIIVEFNKDVVA